MKNYILIPLALLVFASCLQFCTKSKDNDKTKEMESPMIVEPDANDERSMDHGMMKTMNMSMDKMTSMQMTGDFDLDFANMMIMHHQGSIEMGEMEIAKGTDAGLKSMAEKMISAQKEEIAHFQTIINNYKSPTAHKHKEMHNDLNDGMNRMMNKMTNMKMTGNTDKDFVMMMIPHHEGALEMAEAELSQGHNVELKKMAEKMIRDQKNELDELRGWVAKH